MKNLSIVIYLNLFASLLCLSIRANAQDVTFSLFDQNKTHYNPALTGLHSGLIHTNFVYRKQWLNFPGEFSTTNFNLDYKEYGSCGFGLFVISDIEGESLLTTNSFGANFSWRGEISEYSGAFFQLGVKASYNVKEIDLSRLTFSDELDEIYGPIYGSTYIADRNRSDYIDFSVGGMVSFNAYNLFTNIIGVAIHHFTRPNISFQGGADKIPIKLTLHAQTEYNTQVYSLNRRDKMRIGPSLVYEMQGSHIGSSQSANSLMCGFDIDSDPLSGGIWYRTQFSNNSDRNYRALIFKLGLRIYSQNNKVVYNLFYAYDLATKNYTKYTRDSHEIGLSMSFSFRRRFKCHNKF
ncbi:PorP/SprF family type IX secretion system membrane protein [Ancylomarina sp. YFZ004]